MTTTQTSFAGGVVLLSSTLDDVTATQLGLKQYLHGTTYNGGIAPTVTCAQGGFSVVRARFIPYQMQDGAWRLRFNISNNFTLTSVTNLTITINGILFKNIANDYQSVSAFLLSATLAVKVYCDPNTATLLLNAPSTSASGLNMSGDVELNAKPTWAY